MKLLIATNNPAKFNRYRARLSRFDHLQVVSPGEAAVSLAVEESGLTAAENARLKACACLAASGIPSLGIDEALFIPALPADEQPGVFVRRQGEKHLSDEEILTFYLRVARGLAPEQREMRWVFALCLAVPGGALFEAEAFWAGILIDEPQLPFNPGYPLSVILRDPESGKVVSQLSAEEARARDRDIEVKLAHLIEAAGLSSP